MAKLYRQDAPHRHSLMPVVESSQHEAAISGDLVVLVVQDRILCPAVVIFAASMAHTDNNIHNHSCSSVCQHDVQTTEDIPV